MCARVNTNEDQARQGRQVRQGGPGGLEDPEDLK